jgi:hypothetical protein
LHFNTLFDFTVAGSGGPLRDICRKSDKVKRPETAVHKLSGSVKLSQITSRLDPE